MADHPVERRSAPRFAATFRIRLGYPDLDAFLEGYAVNISKGGIYVPTKQPREPGTEVRFELLLKDGNPAVVGVGRVAWSKPFNPQNPGERYGMGVHFLALEGASAEIVRKAVAWREKHGHGDREVTEQGEPKAAAATAEERKSVESKPEPPAPEKHEPERAVAGPRREAAEAPTTEPPKKEPERVAAEPRTQEPERRAPARDRIDLARKVLGQRKVTMGNVDDLLASLRGKEVAKRPAVAPPPPQPEPQPVRAEPAPEPPPRPAGSGAPVAESRPAGPQPAAADEVSAYAVAGVESGPIGLVPAPEAKPAAEPQPPPRAPEASPAVEPRPLPEPPPPPDDDMPSLEDLEAALASVSAPPPPSGPNVPQAKAALEIEVGAAAVVARTARAAPHDADGLDLPAWDEEPAAPTLSEQLAQSDRVAEVEGEEGVSQVLEATDDLDLESLPKSTRELRAVQRGTSSKPPSGLFEDIPGAALPEPAPQVPSEPELPVVGGVVPPKVEEAVRQKIADLLAGAEEGETAVMTEEEQARLGQRMQSQVPSRPSVADLPPPPDMPAPIPEAPVEDRKGGLLGKLFGRKKK